MAKHDPEGRVGLYVDEWGTWYSPLPGSNPAFLVQQNSIRDAVVAGATFNIFHAPARRVKMANIAQLVSLVNLDPKAPVTVAATIQGPKLEG